MSGPPVGEALKPVLEHWRAGRLEAADSVCQQVVSNFPNDPNALQLAGIINGQLRRHAAAEIYFGRAIVAAPHVAPLYLNLSLTLEKQGKLREALQSCRHAVVLSPDDATAHNQLGVFLRQAGDLDEAIASHQRAIQLKPDFARALNSLGNARQEKREFASAIECYHKAIALQGDNPKFLCGLAGALQESGQLDLALETFQRALLIRKDDIDALNGIAGAQLETGAIESAIQNLRAATALNPGSVSTHDRLLFALLHDSAGTFESRQAENKRWCERHAQPLLLCPACNVDRNPDRRLRIGFVSADFRGHAVGLFIAPLFAEVDREQFEIFCYSQVMIPDAQTAWFESHTDGWRRIVGESDVAVVRQIQEDRIDILVDLSMHTAGNRLPVFACKPAPVQVTYLAYAGGTALPAIDYRLTDLFLDPDEFNDRFYSEKSFRLDGTYWCYSPSPAASEASNLPPVQHQHLTFGCLNKFAKISQDTLNVWAKLLNRLPKSCLILHAHPGKHRQHVQDFFASRDVLAPRIEFVSQLSTADYFQMYRRIGIALDPFPYTGGTTTCDALWMGVPVITLAGQTAIERAGVSILSNSGFAEWVAETREQYVQIAVDLANDTAALTAIRETMRDRLQQARLMDRSAFARSIERAFRAMWREFCTD